jgi:polyisoprenoid-binding protein YceI
LGNTAAESTIDLRLPVQSLQVDDAAIRAEEGHAFSNAVSDKDIAGTRRNMMGRKLLQADQFNDIRVASRRVSGEFPDITIEAEITIRGRQQLVDLPAFVETYEDRIVASGSVDITHAQLGLTAFTAAFGAMRVGERMTFKYRIEAKREDDPG